MTGTGKVKKRKKKNYYCAKFFTDEIYKTEVFKKSSTLWFRAGQLTGQPDTVQLHFLM